MGAIYTIGYGNRGIEEFIRLLKQYEIEFLIDVRSQPYSKFSPDFSQKRLKDVLQSHSVRYVFMGDTLGGRPRDPDCYIDDDNVDYLKVQTKQFYVDGISRLQNAFDQELNIVLMCSEVKPEQCHRSKLIGASLLKAGFPVQHIDEKGALKPQETVLNKPGQPPKRLFEPGDEEAPRLKSRKSYKSLRASLENRNDS